MADWFEFAACRGKPTEWWFPEAGVPTPETALAVLVCSTCVVRRSCREYAMSKGIKHGIWGGLSERARRRVRKTVAA